MCGELKRQMSHHEECLTMCGICPSCVFAPVPPGSTPCLWKASDMFKRRFLVKLILRCTSTQMLQNIQSALGVTSCSLVTYVRSSSPYFPQDYPGRSTDLEQDGKPIGSDVNKIWDWFAKSPNWIKSRYLIHLLSRYDLEMLRMVANLINVLLIRQKRGCLQIHGSSRGTIPHDEDSDEDKEDPALMLVPGSSKSLSGVSQYRDLISCLPIALSKRILGLLDEHALKCCKKVCQQWQQLAQETMEEFKLRRTFDDQAKMITMGYKGINVASPTYANFVEVPVPVKDDENGDIGPIIVQKVKPFEAAYAKVQTKTVQMEERNVYCSAYFTTMLLEIEDPNRVVDYTGGSLMAMGSKDCKLHLAHVTSKMKVFTVMKGHVGSIRAVLLCEDRDLVITASCDANIRCWNLKTDRCVMKLLGHKRTVTCLDVHADRLVSGAKDWRVYVWSLQTGKLFQEFNFKHHSAVHCVKINTTTVYSSCDSGLVKVWDMGSASLLRVINAHRTAVKCLFVDKWHILSGDTAGHVKAWSVSRDAKQCLMTFSHPREVKSLIICYLRVITGCADGRIRVFNFLTGDCLRDIVAETEPGRLISVHFHDNSILVNSKSGVRRIHFNKVFWDYSVDGGQDAAAEESADPLRKSPFASARGDHMARPASLGQKKKPEQAKLLNRPRPRSTPAKCLSQDKGHHAKPSVIVSERATSERIKRRGLHHPLTPEFMLLRLNTMQKAQSMDEVGINMERNARLRDSWGPSLDQDPLQLGSELRTLKLSTQARRHPEAQKRAQTCIPILKKSLQPTYKKYNGRHSISSQH